MIIKGEQFKAGDVVIWTRVNGTTERVRFKSYLPDVNVAAGPENSTFPSAPVCLVVRLTNGMETTVPLAELSRLT